MDLIVTALALALAAAAPGDCVAAAEALVAHVEKHPMPKRAPLIAAAFAKDGKLSCGRWTAESLVAPEPLPAGCATRRSACVKTPTLELADRLVETVDAATLVRVQRLAGLLAKASQLSDAHRRLLETWVLSAALSRGG